MALSKAHVDHAFKSHDNSLVVTIAELTTSKTLPMREAEDIVSTLCSANICSFDPELARDAAVRKRVTNFLARTGAKVAPLLSRGKVGRPVGHCYSNAYQEFKETGNPIAYGWVDGNTVINDYFLSYIPHAFNYDVKTGQFYDTTYFLLEKRRITLPVFVITDLVQAVNPHDITKFTPRQAVDKTVGGWVFLTHKTKTYVLQGWDHCSREQDAKRPRKYERLKVAEVLA